MSNPIRPLHWAPSTITRLFLRFRGPTGCSLSPTCGPDLTMSQALQVTQASTRAAVSARPARCVPHPVPPCSNRLLALCGTAPHTLPVVCTLPLACRRTTVQVVSSVEGVKSAAKKSAALAASVLIAGVRSWGGSAGWQSQAPRSSCRTSRPPPHPPPAPDMVAPPSAAPSANPAPPLPPFAPPACSPPMPCPSTTCRA